MTYRFSTIPHDLEVKTTVFDNALDFVAQFVVYERKNKWCVLHAVLSVLVSVV